MKIFVTVPVFKEPQYVVKFIRSWERVYDQTIVIFIVNGSPGDETTQIIKDYSGPLQISEIEGHAKLFWSGLVSLGLIATSKCANADDIVVLTNIDITFSEDPLSDILRRMLLQKRFQVASLVQSKEGILLSAGVVVRSWLLSLNRHLMVGQRSDQTTKQWISATYLPTRFLVYPVEALRKVGLPNSYRLPHYCADYEYSNRLRIAGYQPLVYTGSVVCNDGSNTGFKSFEQRTRIFERFSQCMDMKCSYNLKHRFWFVLLVYPGWYKIPGVLSHFFKIGLELLWGGARLERTRAQQNEGGHR